MLNVAEVESSLSLLAPKRAVMIRPRATYITIMDMPYMQASLIDLLRSLPFLRKKLTVIGIIGHTQGVNRATRPPRKQVKNMYQSEPCEMGASEPASSYFTGVQRSDSALVSSTTGAATQSAATLSTATASVSTALSATSSTGAVASSAFFSSALGAFTLAVPVKLNVSRDGGIQFSSLHAP